MTEEIIKCPSCGSNIPLNETLANQAKESARKEFEARGREKDNEIKKREEALERARQEIEASQRALSETVEKRLVSEKLRLSLEAEKKAREAVLVELSDLNAEKAEKDKLLAVARDAELEQRKKARDLEERNKTLELDMARKLDEERERIKAAAFDTFSEEHRLKDLEKDKQLGDMRKTIDELKRKSEQGSMQTQGEVLELDLESMLKARFPVDAIEPVPKGRRGADILHRVYTRGGTICGTIIWEFKSTKAWSDDWIAKLKDDQREERADIAVIVTGTMPKGVAAFALVEGVWVTSIALAGPLAEALRVNLIQLSSSRLASVGKNEKMEAIYNYLTGPEFRQKVEAIAEAFTAMKDDLEHEKRAMTKIWAKRDKQIERVVTNTLRMYGDVQGIAMLPDIKSLELGAGAVDSESEDGTGLF